MIAKNNDKITRAIKKGNKNNDLFYNAKNETKKKAGQRTVVNFNNAKKKERETDGRRYSKKKKALFAILRAYESFGPKRVFIFVEAAPSVDLRN